MFSGHMTQFSQQKCVCVGLPWFKSFLFDSFFHFACFRHHRPSYPNSAGIDQDPPPPWLTSYWTKSIADNHEVTQMKCDPLRIHFLTFLGIYIPCSVLHTKSRGDLMVWYKPSFFFLFDSWFSAISEHWVRQNVLKFSITYKLRQLRRAGNKKRCVSRHV